MVYRGSDNDNPEYFVGIDLRKKFMQVAMMDSGGKIHQNKKVECDPRDVARAFPKLPVNARYVVVISANRHNLRRSDPLV